MSLPPDTQAAVQAASASICMQMFSTLCPLPTPVLYALLGAGAAMLVQREMDMCRTRRRIADGAMGSPSSSSSGTTESTRCRWSRKRTQPELADTPDGDVPTPEPTQAIARRKDDNSNKFCISQIVGCLNHRRSRRDARQPEDVWDVQSAVDPAPSSPDSSSDDLSDSSVSDALLTHPETIQSEVSHIQTALQHLSFKLDTLAVWAKSLKQ